MIEKFLDIELKYKLLNKNYKGFYFWQYSRFMIFSEILGLLDINTIKKKKVIKNRFKTVRVLLTRSTLFRTKKSDLLIIGAFREKISESASYGCIYTSEIIKRIQRPYLLHYYYRVMQNEVDGVLYDVDLQFFTKTLGVFLKKRTKIEFDDNFKNAINELGKAYDCELNFERIAEIVNNNYFRWIISRRYYRRILQKTAPKLILEVCSYGSYNLVINEVAKELKIPVVELQHGIMGEGHIAYNFAEECDLKIFPDYIFTYSAFWNLDTKFPISRERIIPTGFPFMEKTVEEYKSKEAIAKNKDLITILMISQYNMGNLADFTVELYDLLIKEYKGKFKIIYKMHPGENLNSFDSYQKLREYSDRIEVVENETKSMYKCFGEADIQVGISTTGLYEGLAFNLDTFILNSPGSERLQNLVDLNLAKFIKKPSDLLDGLLHEKSENNAKEAAVLWKKGSLNNILIEIEKIIKRGY